MICWPTRYDDAGLQAQIVKNVDYKTFFSEAPLMKKIRWRDKLVDELAKGKPMEKILIGAPFALRLLDE